ncbi:MAG TPA: ATP synthase F1 subunit gamma [Deltaproteobacteria bacterium]|jgi:F-type H+-transporting ATPase subunit gamma|nr:ATP synthase F1 subunit gamma [Deltaproteobacteria bacterium]
MATLRDIKRKIEAVRKTSQITKAMNMVAAAKLRGAQQNMEKFHPYALKFREFIGRLAAGVEDASEYALLTPKEEVKTVELLLVTADRGLCGSFNTNLLVAAEKFIKARNAEGVEVSLINAGRKARDYFRRRPVKVRDSHTGLLNKVAYEDARRLGSELIELFETGGADEVYILYSHFITIAKQQPSVVRLLPISAAGQQEGEKAFEYLFEPSHQALLTDLLPNYIYVQVLESLYQTCVGEHAARMAAMENATSNCKELVRTLTLTYNKARQAGITKELMDIVGGSEALKK